ncbi:hypothetical protein OSSY52_02040 [Tepiditoga spiralis]|uniref:Uncharacterized protein n=1 Tax=Tepiditoga spiralis TaxID=2108365 RepID=A0A7G1G5K2_9BACT|nr:hypothetical protein [Tepiditoga spiralis]BBE30063.1 hypothetical protein OSSY52_02040 [Tepiditoga spiralis]
MKKFFLILVSLMISILIFSNDPWKNMEDIQKEIYDTFDNNGGSEVPWYYDENKHSDVDTEIFYQYYSDIKESNSIDEIIIITKDALKKLYSKMMEEDYEVTEEDFNTYILLNYTWAALYEGIFGWDLPWKKTLNNISTWIPSVLKKDGSVIGNFFKLNNSLYKLNQHKYIKVTEHKIIDNFFENPYSDTWFLMIKEYKKIKKFYFFMKEELEKYKEFLSSDYSKNKEKIQKTLKYIDLSSLYFKKLDSIARYEVFDRLVVPIINYEYELYLKYYDNNIIFFKDKEKKEKEKEVALQFNKVTNLIDYCVADDTKEWFIDFQKMLKKYLGEKEWNELKLYGKLSQEWLRLLPEVKVDY